MVPRVLLACAEEVSSRLKSLLEQRDVLQLDTADNIVSAIRSTTSVAYDLVVIDLSLRGAFLLLDTLRAIEPARRPLVIALRGSARERAVLDSDVVTAVLAAGEIEISGDLVVQLATVAARREPQSENSCPAT